MAKDNDITIIIDGKTHHLSRGNMNAFKALPWSERKQLIELLEDIKQAEYINKPAEPDLAETQINGSGKSTTVSDQIQSDLNKGTANQMPAETTVDAGFDPQVKKSNQDVDDLMQRLILEGQQNRKPIPERSVVVKYLLVAVVVIILIAMMF